MTNLKQTVDEISYKVIAETHPRVIEVINAALDKGDNAKRIEKALLRRFGHNSLTALMAIGTAHYLEAKRRERQQ